MNSQLMALQFGLRITVNVFSLLAFATAARADIFQWEYVDPADASQGKRQCTTLTPDGAGVDAMPGADLSGHNLTMAYLIGVDLTGATLTDADFADAEIRGAALRRVITSTGPRGTGVTLTQLYSTASYQGHDLTGINLSQTNLFVGNFAGQNLTNAHFYFATLTGADFTGAEIRGASFTLFNQSSFGTGLSLSQLFSTASYQARDLRGVQGLDLSAEITTNVILPTGHINGLNLEGGAPLILRDYNGDPTRPNPLDRPPIPVTVDQHLAMGPGGTLRMVFEANAWDSTISFAPGIPVALGGTLELTFADDVNLATQVGRTFDIFDWTGVTPTGAFAISSPYAWNLSNVYTTGEVTLTAIPEPATTALIAAAVSVNSLRHRRRPRRS